MLPLRHLRYWQIASVLILLLVLAATLMPAFWFWGDKSSGLAWFKGVDKWLHGITFAVLSLWFAGLYHRQSYWRIAIGLLLFGLAIEVCQRMVGYRTAEWLDVGADMAGILLGLAIAVAGLGGWSLRFERYIAEFRT
jgi:VanZ family protein